MNDLFKELFMSNYINNKTTFIPCGYLRNELYRMYDITMDGDLEENESIDDNYISIEYKYDDINSGTYDIYRSTEECLLNEELVEQIDDVLGILREKEEAVIRMRFGLVDDCTEYTLEEIARELKVTRERVRQIESSAIKKLKHPRIDKKLKTYVRGSANMETIRFDFIANYLVKPLVKHNNEIDYKYGIGKGMVYRIRENTINNIKLDIVNFIHKKLIGKRALIIDATKKENIVSTIYKEHGIDIDIYSLGELFITDNKDHVDVEIDIDYKTYEISEWGGLTEI